jgi:ankyrin repeat protein
MVLMVKLLAEKGADMESKDNNGQTPLSRAAGSGREALARLQFIQT